MDSSYINKGCPICKRQLKKEEFQELTSEVCSICQRKPKLPVLTTSGSLSCWACYYKTHCDQIIPIYGTEDESEKKPDPAVLPRPVLPPDVLIDVGSVMINSSRPIDVNPTMINSRPGQSTHHTDDSRRATSSIESIDIICGFFGLIFSIAVIGLMIFPMVGVFFLPWLVDAHYVLIGFFVVGEVLSILTIILRSFLGQHKVLAILYCLGRLLSFCSFVSIMTYITAPKGSFASSWIVPGVFSQIIFLLFFGTFC
jgi:hypothetical protein